MTSRRDVVRAIGATLLGVARPADAQRTGSVPRIGFLSLRPGPTEFDAAFAQGLRDLGYIEGTTIVVDRRYANGSDERLRAMAAELVASRIDIAVVEAGARILEQMNPTLPIVIPLAGDPVRQGLIVNMARPGGFITGQSALAPELSRKRLELFLEAFPGMRRVGALHNAANVANAAAQIQESLDAGTALGVQVEALPVAFPAAIVAGFADAVRKGLQGIVVLSDTATITHRADLGAAALVQRMPTMFANRQYLIGGGLMSYGPDVLAMFRRGAYFVDRILKGTKPGDIPFEQPTRFELAINLKTARALGVTIPQAVLLRADEVIQ